MYLKVSLLFFCFCCAFPGFSQVDTTVLLPSAEILAHPLRTSPLNPSKEVWNTQEPAKPLPIHLGDLLVQQAGVFIKSYGLGSLATTSVRGGSAAQTLLLWNGLPLQSPMLGLSDLALITTGLMDEIAIQFGGNGANWGSGSVSGSVFLNNNLEFQKGSSANLHISSGSFGFLGYQVAVQHSEEKIALSTRIRHSQAQNDFSFSPAPGIAQQRQTNAQNRQSAVIHSMGYLLSPNSQLNIHWWLQQADREIPPTLTQAISKASQKDLSNRIMAHFQSGKRNVLWQLKAALFQEELDYRDPQILLESKSYFWSTFLEGEMDWRITPFQQIQGSLQFSYTEAQIPAYLQKRNQGQISLVNNFRQQWDSLSVELQNRVSMVDGALIPWVGGVSMRFNLNGKWSVYGQCLRTFRLPTLNDRFWRPGGNPDLQPEKGWSQELGLQWHQSGPGGITYTYRLSGFNRDIKNWILWTKVPATPFWSPQNVNNVLSQGLEQRFSGTAEVGEFSLSLTGGFDLIRSTFKEAVALPKIEAGEPLLYVPESQGNLGLTVQYAGVQLSYQHAFSASFATDQGPLPKYDVGYVSIQVENNWEMAKGRFFVQIENVWNRSYQVVINRPIPGRYARVGFYLDFQSNKENK